MIARKPANMNKAAAVHALMPVLHVTGDEPRDFDVLHLAGNERRDFDVLMFCTLQEMNNEILMF
jgi:hypothetical protein